MHRSMRRSLHASIAVLMVVFAAACSPTEDDTGNPGDGGTPTAPFPVAAGVQVAQSLAAMQRRGWTICYEDNYGTFGPTVSEILAGCSGGYLMLACGQDADLLAVAAADTRAIVTQADAESASAHHVSGGVGWYFTNTLSWGFFPAGDTVNRNSCDDATTQADRRLCWEIASDTTEIERGYRCGASVGLSNATWRRIVLAHP